jgi:hypothetical protein
MKFFESLAHYILPRHSNNHRAKLIHPSSLFLFSVFLVIYQFLLNFLPSSGKNILGYASNIPTEEIIKLTNEKRSNASINKLRVNTLLSSAARAKGEHMLKNGYWAHIAPDGTEPWKFFTDVGYRYRYAGENLARDFTNPVSVVDAWMASPSHRENLLSTKYSDIGVAVVEGNLNGVDTTIVVQLFGYPLDETQINTVRAGNDSVLPTTAPLALITEKSTYLSPTMTLTPTPEVVAASLETLPPIEDQANVFKVLLSPFGTTKGISVIITSLLLIVFIVDGIIVARRRIPRIGGRTFAHLSFLGMILAIVLILKAGRIL